MCGICGVVNLDGLTREDLGRFTKVLLNSQSRGKMASGVANQRLNYVKASEDASKLVKTKEYKEFFDKSIGLQWVIGHTRYATRGTPQDNINNHPLSTMPDKYLLVHNGVVGTSLWKENRETTDTYVIADAITKRWVEGSLFDSVSNAFVKFHGAAAIIVTSPDEIVVAKMVNPVIFKIKDKRHFFIASEEGFMSEIEGELIKFPEGNIIGFGKGGSIRRAELPDSISKEPFPRNFDWASYAPPVEKWTYVDKEDESEGEEENLTAYSDKQGFQHKLMPNWNKVVPVRRHKRIQ